MQTAYASIQHLAVLNVGEGGEPLAIVLPNVEAGTRLLGVERTRLGVESLAGCHGPRSSDKARNEACRVKCMDFTKNAGQKMFLRGSLGWSKVRSPRLQSKTARSHWSSSSGHIGNEAQIQRARQPLKFLVLRGEVSTLGTKSKNFGLLASIEQKFRVLILVGRCTLCQEKKN